MRRHPGRALSMFARKSVLLETASNLVVNKNYTNMIKNYRAEKYYEQKSMDFSRGRTIKRKTFQRGHFGACLDFQRL